MNIEFHYYSVYIIAKKAGFDKKSSFILAYSSQYTDDNSQKCLVKIKGDKEYKNYISQTTQTISGVSFVTIHGAYASANKTKIVRLTEVKPFLLNFAYPGRTTRQMFTCVL